MTPGGPSLDPAAGVPSRRQWAASVATVAITLVAAAPWLVSLRNDRVGWACPVVMDEGFTVHDVEGCARLFFQAAAAGIVVAVAVAAGVLAASSTIARGRRRSMPWRTAFAAAVIGSTITGASTWALGYDSGAEHGARTSAVAALAVPCLVAAGLVVAVVMTRQHASPADR